MDVVGLIITKKSLERLLCKIDIKIAVTENEGVKQARIEQRNMLNEVWLTLNELEGVLGKQETYLYEQRKEIRELRLENKDLKERFDIELKMSKF
jgi:predicted transglutaminase-like protease